MAVAASSAPSSASAPLILQIGPVQTLGAPSPPRLASKMMIEGHGPEQIGDGDAQTLRNCSYGLRGEVAVPVVKIV